MHDPTFSHNLLRAAASAIPSTPRRRQLRCTRSSHLPTLTLQQRRNSPVSVATVLTGQGWRAHGDGALRQRELARHLWANNDRFGQCIFVDPLDRSIALCSWPLSTASRHGAHSLRTFRAPAPPHNATAQGLEVSVARHLTRSFPSCRKAGQVRRSSTRHVEALAYNSSDRNPQGTRASLPPSGSPSPCPLRQAGLS
jgi:hypothetical protein